AREQRRLLRPLRDGLARPLLRADRTRERVAPARLVAHRGAPPRRPRAARARGRARGAARAAPPRRAARAHAGGAGALRPGDRAALALAPRVLRERLLDLPRDELPRRAPRRAHRERARERTRRRPARRRPRLAPVRWRGPADAPHRGRRARAARELAPRRL